MELVIVAILFVALMACWFILPGQIEGGHARSDAKPAKVAPAKGTA